MCHGDWSRIRPVGRWPRVPQTFGLSAWGGPPLPRVLGWESTQVPLSATGDDASVLCSFGHQALLLMYLELLCLCVLLSLRCTEESTSLHCSFPRTFYYLMQVQFYLECKIYDVFLINFSFLSSFRFMKKNWAESTENSHIPFVPATATASLIWDIPHLQGTFVTTDAPTLTHPYHPESILYIRVHSWCCTFCGFRWMYSDMYLAL